MKDSRFPIAPAFFPTFIMIIACCSCVTNELSWPPFSTPCENRAFTVLMTAWVACCGVRTVKLTEFDATPPGLVTVTLKLPAVAMSEARMAAVSCVALTNVVARALPLKVTIEPVTKFAPFTVKGKAAAPAMALRGHMLVIVGRCSLWTVRLYTDPKPPKAKKEDPGP